MQYPMPEAGASLQSSESISMLDYCMTPDRAPRYAFSTSTISRSPVDAADPITVRLRPASGNQARNGALTTMSHRKQDNTSRASMMGGKTKMVCCEQWSDN
jgi:hypothetical protein